MTRQDGVSSSHRRGGDTPETGHVFINKGVIVKDVIIVGAGLAGLSAAWRLRHWDTLVLEASDRVGGRIMSERRGQYWLNWGGHMFSGPGSSTDALLHEVGIDAGVLPGALAGIEMNGKFISKGSMAMFPFRLPMPFKARVDTLTGGIKLVAALLGKYINVVRTRPGESGAIRQQRIYDFDNNRTFRDFIGKLHPDAEALYATTVQRSTGSIDEISAGSGIGYFSLVLGIGQGLNRGIIGGPSTLTESMATALGNRIQLGTRVSEVIHKSDSVVVRYTQGGKDYEVEAHTAILATTPDVTHKIAVDLPSDIRDALGQIKFGPHVSVAFLTDETGPRRWDNTYCVVAPKHTFSIMTNQASLIRGSESQRQPGGSIFAFAPGQSGAKLMEMDNEDIVQLAQKEIDKSLGQGFGESVVEGRAEKFAFGSPYCYPGRAKIQPTLMRGASRVFLAGDFLGTLYTETAITSGMTAAQNAASLLATRKQTLLA